MKYAKRRDVNEREIIDALEAVGCAVAQLGDAGVPDLLVSYRLVLYILEVKMPLGPRGGLPEHRDHEGGRGDLTAAQVKWWAKWAAASGVAPTVVRTPLDALRAIGASGDRADGQDAAEGK